MNGNLDKKNGFYVQAARPLCRSATAAFDQLGWLVLAWAACMALDWLSGGAIRRQQGEWSNAAAARDRLQSRHGGGRLRSGADKLSFKRSGAENLPAFGDGVGFDFEG